MFYFLHIDNVECSVAAGAAYAKHVCTRTHQMLKLKSSTKWHIHTYIYIYLDMYTLFSLFVLYRPKRTALQYTVSGVHPAASVCVGSMKASFNVKHINPSSSSVCALGLQWARHAPPQTALWRLSEQRRALARGPKREGWEQSVQAGSPAFRSVFSLIAHVETGHCV